LRQNDFARFQSVGSARISEYLAFGYLSGADTFYSSVSKLMPGHWLELTDTGKLHVEQYWDLQAVSDESPQGEAYCVQSYRELLEGAVNSHLMSDVPLGGFLRGGVDSSPVAALMTKIRREPIETFSVGYSEQNYSELPYARRVAQHINSIHHEVFVSRQDFFTAWPKLIWHEDEPIVWPSSVALFFVAQLARERVKVVLTGEGSDEALAGYSRYALRTTKRNYSQTAVTSSVQQVIRTDRSKRVLCFPGTRSSPIAARATIHLREIQDRAHPQSTTAGMDPAYEWSSSK